MNDAEKYRNKLKTSFDSIKTEEILSKILSYFYMFLVAHSATQYNGLCVCICYIQVKLMPTLRNTVKIKKMIGYQNCVAKDTIRIKG